MYEYAYNYPNLFDNIGLNADFWPNDMLGWNSGNNGQSTPNWGINNVVPYVQAKAHVWTQEMTDAINDSVTAWNIAKPSNQFNPSQVIFEENEKGLMYTQLKARQTEIIAAFGG